VDPLSAQREAISVLAAALGARVEVGGIEPWRAGADEVPGLLVWRRGRSRALALVHAGACVQPGGGAAAAAAWLAACGLPSRSMSGVALGVVLRYFGVLEPPWFPDALEVEAITAHYAGQEVEGPSLVFDAEGVGVLEVEARVAGRHGGGYMPLERWRRSVRLGVDAIEVTTRRVRG